MLNSSLEASQQSWALSLVAHRDNQLTNTPLMAFLPSPYRCFTAISLFLGSPPRPPNKLSAPKSTSQVLLLKSSKLEWIPAWNPGANASAHVKRGYSSLWLVSVGNVSNKRGLRNYPVLSEFLNLLCQKDHIFPLIYRMSAHLGLNPGCSIY